MPSTVDGSGSGLALASSSKKHNGEFDNDDNDDDNVTTPIATNSNNHPTNSSTLSSSSSSITTNKMKFPNKTIITITIISSLLFPLVGMYGMIIFHPWMDHFFGSESGGTGSVLLSMSSSSSLFAAAAAFTSSSTIIDVIPTTMVDQGAAPAGADAGVVERGMIIMPTKMKTTVQNDHEDYYVDNNNNNDDDDDENGGREMITSFAARREQCDNKKEEEKEERKVIVDGIEDDELKDDSAQKVKNDDEDAEEYQHHHPSLSNDTDHVSTNDIICINCHAIFRIHVNITFQGGGAVDYFSSPPSSSLSSSSTKITHDLNFFITLREVSTTTHDNDRGLVYLQKDDQPLNLHCGTSTVKTNPAADTAAFKKNKGTSCNDDNDVHTTSLNFRNTYNNDMCQSIFIIAVPYTSFSSSGGYNSTMSSSTMIDERIVLVSLLREWSDSAGSKRRRIVDQWMINIVIPRAKEGTGSLAAAAAGEPFLHPTIYSVKLRDTVKYAAVTEEMIVKELAVDKHSSSESLVSPSTMHEVIIGCLVGIIAGVAILAVIYKFAQRDDSDDDDDEGELLISTPDILALQNANGGELAPYSHHHHQSSSPPLFYPSNASTSPDRLSQATKEEREIASLRSQSTPTNLSPLFDDEAEAWDDNENGSTENDEEEEVVGSEIENISQELEEGEDSSVDASQSEVGSNQDDKKGVEGSEIDVGPAQVFLPNVNVQAEANSSPLTFHQSMNSKTSPTLNQVNMPPGACADFDESMMCLPNVDVQSDASGSPSQPPIHASPSSSAAVASVDMSHQVLCATNEAQRAVFQRALNEESSAFGCASAGSAVNKSIKKTAKTRDDEEEASSMNSPSPLLKSDNNTFGIANHQHLSVHTRNGSLRGSGSHHDMSYVNQRLSVSSSPSVTSAPRNSKSPSVTRSSPGKWNHIDWKRRTLPCVSHEDTLHEKENTQSNARTPPSAKAALYSPSSTVAATVAEFAVPRRKNTWRADERPVPLSCGSAGQNKRLGGSPDLFATSKEVNASKDELIDFESRTNDDTSIDSQNVSSSRSGTRSNVSKMSKSRKRKSKTEKKLLATIKASDKHKPPSGLNHLSQHMEEGVWEHSSDTW